MKHKKIIDFLEKEFPHEVQDKNDISGFQFGNLNDEFFGCLITTDVTFESIEYAVSNKLNLIITHHPLLYPNPVIAFESPFLRKKFLLLEKNNITVFTLHTNLDFLPGGMNYSLAKLFFPKQKIYIKSNYSKVIKKIDTKKLLNKIKKTLKTPVRYYFSSNKTNNIGFISGAGGSLIPSIVQKDKKIDTFITGDIKFSDFIFAKDNKINIFDIGHEIEILLFKNLFEILKKKFFREKIFYFSSIEILYK